jgi:hypothetical protein
MFGNARHEWKIGDTVQDSETWRKGTIIEFSESVVGTPVVVVNCGDGIEKCWFVHNLVAVYKEDEEYQEIPELTEKERMLRFFASSAHDERR